MGVYNNRKRKKSRTMEQTRHYAERNYRQTIIDSMGGAGKVILTNVIDRGHINGAERFELTEKGIIYVYNDGSNRLITILFARVGQLYSRFGGKFESLPIATQISVKTYCREHQAKKLNEM